MFFDNQRRLEKKFYILIFSSPTKRLNQQYSSRVSRQKLFTYVEFVDTGIHAVLQLSCSNFRFYSSRRKKFTKVRKSSKTPQICLRQIRRTLMPDDTLNIRLY